MDETMRFGSYLAAGLLAAVIAAGGVLGVFFMREPEPTPVSGMASVFPCALMQAEAYVDLSGKAVCPTKALSFCLLMLLYYTAVGENLTVLCAPFS